MITRQLTKDRRQSVPAEKTLTHVSQFPSTTTHSSLPVKARVRGQGQRCQACTVVGHFRTILRPQAWRHGSHTPKSAGRVSMGINASVHFAIAPVTCPGRTSSSKQFLRVVADVVDVSADREVNLCRSGRSRGCGSPPRGASLDLLHLPR